MGTRSGRLQNGALKDFYLSRGMLFKLHMDLLYACDLDCHHCYLDDKSRPQVPGDRIIDILEQGSHLGALQVTFSGGEIFLRKDLFRLVEAARRLRYHIRLKTHGGNVTAEHARRIAELGVAAVDFSVYALDDEVHDAFTRKKGSLSRTLRAIDLLSEAGVEVNVKCSVTTFNVAHYRDLVEHFDARGIDASFNARIRGTNTVTTNTYPLNLEVEEKVRLEIYRIEQHGGPPATPPRAAPSAESYFCTAGRTSVYVSPNLKVYPCTAFPMEIGDLSTQTLAEIWRGDTGLQQVRESTRASTGICDTCAARAHCSYCPGAAFIESAGDWLKPPEVVCREAFSRLRAMERYVRGERPTAHPPRGPKRLGSFTILNNTVPTGGNGGGGGCSSC